MKKGITLLEEVLIVVVLIGIGLYFFLPGFNQPQEQNEIITATVAVGEVIPTTDPPLSYQEVSWGKESTLFCSTETGECVSFGLKTDDVPPNGVAFVEIQRRTFLVIQANDKELRIHGGVQSPQR
ncbi:MAG: type II secretion system GspH family protein [Nanoarchaeota archaeon]|nr:type II secretion system GspH family protein [Nanoarchaeota archaeon]